MPRQPKFEDSPFEKVVYNGKIFIYSNPAFIIHFPIVDIIRLLKKTTIIGHLYGKGQNIIKLYGGQYYHSVIGYELKTKRDYQDLKMIKCIFIFSDLQDSTATNLLKYAKEMKIMAVCYSNVDHVYHFYDHLVKSVDRDIQMVPEPIQSFQKEVYVSAKEVIDRMYYLFDLVDTKKMADLFPEFEIIESAEATGPTSLDICVQLLKESSLSEKDKKLNSKVLYDIHSPKLKKMEYLKAQKAIKYDDDIETVNKQMKKLNMCSKFFKSK